MICNFPKSTPTQPATLSYDDVTTIFHEFGHLVNVICNNQRLHAFGSFCKETDFVETPSQLMEQWVSQKEVLKRISKNVKTGDPLPDEMCDKLIASQKSCSALFNLRQLSFGLFDFKLHAEPLKEPLLDVRS